MGVPRRKGREGVPPSYSSKVLAPVQTWRVRSVRGRAVRPLSELGGRGEVVRVVELPWAVGGGRRGRVVRWGRHDEQGDGGGKLPCSVLPALGCNDV